MRYLMKQKVFCLGDDFAVKDDRGRDAFYIDGKVFTLRQTLVFLDPGGSEVARIVKRILSFGPSYDLYRGGKHVANVRKQVDTLFRCPFTIDGPGPDDYEAAGNFIDHAYRFERGGRTVAEVSKRWFSLTDSYGVDIVDGEDPLLILAGTVVIDLCCHDEHGSHGKK